MRLMYMAVRHEGVNPVAAGNRWTATAWQWTCVAQSVQYVHMINEQFPTF